MAGDHGPWTAANYEGMVSQVRRVCEEFGLRLDKRVPPEERERGITIATATVEY